jgi:hypothetical protein
MRKGTGMAGTENPTPRWNSNPNPAMQPKAAVAAPDTPNSILLSLQSNDQQLTAAVTKMTPPAPARYGSTMCAQLSTSSSRDELTTKCTLIWLKLDPGALWRFSMAVSAFFSHSKLLVKGKTFILLSHRVLAQNTDANLLNFSCQMSASISFQAK